MLLSYSLDATTIEVTPEEMESNASTIRRAKKAEEGRGRMVTVLVRLEIHEASDKQVELAPFGRLFPRPVKSMGAIVPEIVADKLKNYAAAREQPMSDLTRVLYTEFLIAKERGSREDSWVRYIEARLNDVQELRQSKKRISYARTKQMRISKKSSKKSTSKKATSKKATKKKATKKVRKRS
jgi:hypothetical protein